MQIRKRCSWFGLKHLLNTLTTPQQKDDFMIKNKSLKI